MVKILDCTIRDGGYINLWDFSQEQVRELYKTLVISGVDIMEIGFRDNIDTYASRYVSRWKKTTDDIISETVGDIYNPTTKIAVMVNYGTTCISDFSVSTESPVDIIRVAFHKKDLENAVKYAGDLKKLGYCICVNAMGTVTYSDEELIRLCELSHLNDIDYLYVADSYGSIKPSDIRQITETINTTLLSLGSTIKLGFHAHNNTQRALMNAELCIELGYEIIDSTMYGMGRGAGNLCTELIMSSLYGIEDPGNSSNRVRVLTKYISEYLLTGDNKFTPKWGYELLLFISAHFNIHPNYVMKMREMGIHNFDIFWNTCVTIMNGPTPSMFNREYLMRTLPE